MCKSLKIAWLFYLTGDCKSSGPWSISLQNREPGMFLWLFGGFIFFIIKVKLFEFFEYSKVAQDKTFKKIFLMQFSFFTVLQS